MKPVIGIVGNMMIMDSGPFPGLERTYVNHDYIDSVLIGGGIPVVLPIVADEQAVSSQLDRVDGVLVSGGFDVDPLRYGQEPSRELGFIYPARDEFDLMAIKAALELGKPVFGICRGLQIINVAFGGTLSQDVSLMDTGELRIKHFQATKSSADTGHTISIASGSRLSKIFPYETVVNSFHHQCIDKLAEGFSATARAKDGIIEAIEKKDGSFVMAVQWHPEMMISGKNRLMPELFRMFVSECCGR
ncbi:MAG: gamma-glutamyl-gamma-aminobutyrate hydrolase family protein [Oligoflexales bacterium]|nr:gamma-glutamyl-gamma-aminobutyrate hydrolase family protein [Oligoflexales bacterium]